MAVLTAMASLLQAQNVLRVDSVEGPAGKTVTLPIVMENQSDIAGVQFDIAVPYKLTKVVDSENEEEKEKAEKKKRKNIRIKFDLDKNVYFS